MKNGRLNEKEQSVLNFLEGKNSLVTLKEIAINCFSKTPDKAYDWAKNSVRDLIADKKIIRVRPGVFRYSASDFIRDIIENDVVKNKKKKDTKFKSGNKIRSGIKPANRNYIGKLSGNTYSRLKREAAYRGIKFEVSQEFLWGLFVKQNGICAWSGLPMTMAKYDSKKKKERAGTASLERKNCNLNYTEKNVIWVLKVVNISKNVLSDREYLALNRVIVYNKDGIVGKNVNINEEKALLRKIKLKK